MTAKASWRGRSSTLREPFGRRGSALMKPGAMARALLWTLQPLTGNHIKALKAPAAPPPAHTLEPKGGRGNTRQLMDGPECSGGAVIRVTI